MPASDYEFSVALVGWMRKCIAVLTSDPLAAQHKLRIVPVGAQVYTEQNRRLIQSNIRTASAISVLGNLALLLLVYRWMPAIVLTVLPTSLALLWTTGFVALYPGVVNLVSMSFIAILAGLGDDQVTYFFSRVPEERARGLNVEQAVAKTYLTTGKSVLFCVLTTSTGTLALALSRFQPLAELGLILTVGLLMLAVHTLVTVPAVMAVWEKFRGYRVTGPPFRGLPAAAGRLGTLVSRRPVPILVLSFALLAASVVGLPRIRISQGVDVFDGGDALGITGQRMLSDRFGLEGAPTVFLLEGSLSSVLSRAERIDHRLRELVASGAIRSIATPSSLVPTASSQHVRRDALAGLDFAGAARLLTAVLAENDLAPAAFEPAIQRMRAWPGPELGLEEVQRHLPSGLLDNTIVEVEPGRYLAAVTTYSSNPEATAALPSSIVDALAREAGPLVEFSYDRVGRELRDRLVVDSRVALSGTVLGVLAIVFLGFRRMKPSLLVLLPIVYGVVVTFGTMALLGHRFSAMAFFAVPLIIGIGIDNGIHLIRRYLEGDGGDVRRVVAASGPAVIQTNLTTIVGFGALMSSSFKPLAELGLITALGVGWTLLASLVVVPALIARSASRAAPPDASLLEESGRQAGA
jgi:predicted RND superfamily exporter protein